MTREVGKEHPVPELCSGTETLASARRCHLAPVMVAWSRHDEEKASALKQYKAEMTTANKRCKAEEFAAKGRLQARVAAAEERLQATLIPIKEYLQRVENAAALRAEKEGGT